MDALKSPECNLRGNSSSRKPRLEFEIAIALIATGLLATCLVLTMLNAGPLWRDETNSINVAQMPSLKELWDSLPFESFPALWLLLLRGWSFLGLADSDTGIRVLGLLVGLGFLGSLWLCMRWVGGRAPILSLALLGSLPAFIFTVGANRAYGLAMCLLVLNFGALWRMIQAPCRSRVIWATVISILFLHCLYYDAVFLSAMLVGAALVVVRRRQWKTLAALVGIGALAGLSMAIYLPVIRRGSTYLSIIQMPFPLSLLWSRLRQAVTAQYSAYLGSPSGPEVWLWVSLVLLALGVAVAMQIQARRSAQKQNPRESAPTNAPCTLVGADLALFGSASMVLGTVGYTCFLLRLQFLTHSWYYMGILSLCAISLDSVLSAPWPAARPWALLRISFLVLMVTWGGSSVWGEAQTRRSNVDLIAAVVGNQAAEGDLIVVQGAWEGITFDRYYRGRARWVTVPPIASHKVHRTDLMWELLNERAPMAPLLAEITEALRRGKTVWLTGIVTLARSEQATPPPNLPTKGSLGPYMRQWSSQLMTHLLDCSQQVVTVNIPVDRPVSSLENLRLIKFSGYRSGEN